jgi:biopolymer transport protein TolR
MASTIERRSHTFGGRRSSRPMSEINVTPMVDVMLVLLIIFMITAPLLTTGVQVDLPEAPAAAIKGQDEPISVSIDREGKVFMGDDEITLDALVVRLQTIAATNPDVRVFVRGDQGIDYGHVMRVVGTIHTAGLRKVALVTYPVTGDVKPRAATGLDSTSG